MHPCTRAGARLLLLSRHFARPLPTTYYPAFQRTCTRRAMSSAVKNETTGAVAPPSADAPGPEGQQPVVKYNFPVSDVPPNPLGEGRYIKTAAALIIGDEILNGKTLDRNSNYFARYCFEQGIELRRIEVIADEEDEIVEASRRMVKNYDFVITSGGIGPTHDDITYASLAKAFNQPLVHHAETLRRMDIMSQHRSDIREQTEEQREARARMALFPANAEVIYTSTDLWVPVVRLEGKLCVFPGIPRLFQRMLDGLTPYLPLPPPNERPCRQQVYTTKPESSIAPYLTELQARTKEDGIRVGSYPLLQTGVYVSLIGYDREHIKKLAEEVAEVLDGRLVTDEEAREMVKAKERGAA